MKKLMTKDKEDKMRKEEIEMAPSPSQSSGWRSLSRPIFGPGAIGSPLDEVLMRIRSYKGSHLGRSRANNLVICSIEVQLTENLGMSLP